MNDFAKGAIVGIILLAILGVVLLMMIG